MNLVSTPTYWPDKNPHPHHFPTLDQDITTEIVVMGGGITGALVALAFYEAGHTVTVVEKGQIAHGSTSASTALLQYEVDVPLSKLIIQIGKEHAERVYHLCGTSISKIEKIAHQLGSEFLAQPSVYFAKDDDDLEYLRTEFLARKNAGFAVEWLEQIQLKQHYGLDSAGAIRSKLAGSIDPYMFTYKVFEYLQQKNVQIFENTEILEIDTDTTVTLTIDYHTIHAKHLVFATGYETQKYLQEKIVTLLSTYALITKPLPQKPWADNALLWNTDDPYLYARLTPDNRILIGGRDLPIVHPWLRDLFIHNRTNAIATEFKKFLPEIQFEIDRRWSGTFGETTDGVAYIGTSPEWKNSSFALGFGGNGITYSALAGELLVKQYQGKEVPDLELFRFGR